VELLLKDYDQKLIRGIIQSTEQSGTVEEFVKYYMESMNTLLGSDTFGCVFFMNSLTDKKVCIDNNPENYSRAYFGWLNGLDLLLQNILEQNSSFVNYERFVESNGQARIFFEESRKIKRHGDYCYLPLCFRHQIVGFYGYVLPDSGKTIFGERDLQLMNLLEPVFNSGIMQSVLREKSRFLDIQICSSHDSGFLYLYPGGLIEVPHQANQDLICEVLCISQISSSTVFSHPLIIQLLADHFSTEQEVAMNSITIERHGTFYTVRALFNKFHLRHGYRYLTLISFERDKDLYSFHEFAVLHNLTKREMEIVGAVVKGQSNRQISQSLFIAEATVKKHLFNIYEKTGCRNRTQLVLSLTSI